MVTSMKTTHGNQDPPGLNHPKASPLQNEELAPPGKSLGFRFCTYLVLWSFFFQTLWPSVSFSMDGGVEVLRPPAPHSFSFPQSAPDPEPIRPLIAIAPFTLQAFVDDQMEGFDDLSSKPVVSFPGATSVAEAQDWFDDSLEAQSLYPGLVVTEQGLLWSQHGLNFLMGLTGHLFVTPLLSAPARTKALRLYNYHGDVVLGGDLSLSHAQVQARNILQVTPNGFIERLEIWAIGTDFKEGAIEGRFTNREGASLTTTHVIVHEGHLENRGDWKVSDGGAIDLQGHEFINRETLTLGQKAAVKTQGLFGNEGTIQGSSYTLEMARGENAGVIMGDAPHIIVSETLTNQADAKILGKSSLRVSGEGTVDNHGMVAGDKALALENRVFTNHSVVHSKGTMRLALQDKLTNVETGRVTALGQTTIEGKATIQNDASLQENGGMAFAGGVHFEDFRGEVINAGLMTSQITMTGVLRKLVNTGTFGASRGYQGLAILDFLNETTGKFLGDGHIILNGRNRGLMQADRLLLQIDGDFIHEASGLLQVKTALDTKGEGRLEQRGQIHTPLFTVNTSQFESFGSLGHDDMEVVVGRSVKSWKNHEKSHFKAKKLTLETGRVASALDDFINEGTLEIGTFINRRSGFTNRGQMTLQHWNQLGLSFKNGLGGEIDVSTSSEFDADTIDNDGNINWEGTLKGRLRQFLNQGGVKIKGDAHLKGSRLVNKKVFKALGVFDWAGETFENHGRMALFDNQVMATRQIINQGLILWTHNTFRTWHFLNMGWVEMTRHLTDTSGNIRTRIFEVAKDQTTTFKKSLVENRGTLRLATNYTPRMTVGGGEFEHWLNTGKMVLPETSLHAQTFTNSGIFQSKHFAFTGQEFITTEGSDISSPERVSLTTTAPLDMKGKLQGDRGVTLTASKIDNHGKIAVQTGKVILVGEFTNHDHLNADEWVYEGETLANFGKIEANTYNRQTPLRRLMNAAGKTLSIRKGTFTAQSLENRGKLELADGLYRFEGWDNKDGTATIDQLCLALLNPLLQGNLDVNILVPFGRSYDSLTIAGETVLRKGGFTTKKLTTKALVALGDGAYAVDQLEMDPGSQIDLLKKVQFEIKRSIDNRGVINAPSGLEVVARDKMSSEILREDDPRMILPGFCVSAEGTKLGKLVVGTPHDPQNLSVLFAHESMIELFLSANVSDWMIGKALVLKGQSFRNYGSLHLPWSVEMAVDDFYQKWGTLKTKGLKLDAKTFRVGETNSAMANLEIYGLLIMLVESDVDCRFGVLKSQDKADIRSRLGNILVGNPIDEEATVRQVLTQSGYHLGEKDVPITKQRKNKAKIVSGRELVLKGKNVDVSFGLAYGAQDVRITAATELRNLSGSILSEKDITLDAPILNLLAGTLYVDESTVLSHVQYAMDCSGFSRQVDYIDKCYLHKEEHTSEPARVSSTRGNIWIRARQGQIIGSQVVTPNGVYYYAHGQYSQDIPSSLKVLDSNATNYHRRFGLHGPMGAYSHYRDDNHEDKTFKAVYRGGTTAQAKADEVLLTGTFNGITVTVRAKNFSAQNTSGRRGAVSTTPFGVQEVDLLGATNVHSPLYHDGLAQGTGITIDVLDSSRRHDRSKQAAVVLLQEEGDAMPSPSRSLTPASLPLPVLSDSVLEFTLAFVLSDYLGTMNIYGRLGDQLVDWLIKQGQKVARKLQKAGIPVTKEAMKSAHRAMLLLENKTIEDKKYASPIFLYTDDMINPHGNESGAVSGTVVDVTASERMDADGNTFRAMAIAKEKDRAEARREAVAREHVDATIFDSDDEDSEDDVPSHPAPDLKLSVKKGDMTLSGVQAQSDGKATIKTKEAGSIHAKATKLEAELDLAVDSAEHVALESTASRLGHGENFRDVINQTSLTSKKGKLTVKSKLDTIVTGVRTSSALGTTFQGKGRLIDQTLALVSQSVIRDGENYTRDTHILKQFSHHQSSAGDITMSYDKAVDLVATQFEVPEEKEVVILGLEGVTCHEDHNVHEHESKQKKEARGLFGRSSTNHFQSSSQTSIGVKVKGGKSRIISAGNIVLTNVDFETNETILTAFDGVVKILPGTNYFTSAFSGKSADMFWQSMTQRLVQQKTYTDSKFKGTIETYAKEVVLQQVCGRTLAFMDRLNLNGATLTFDYVQELYDVKEHNVSGPTAALSAVIALAASIAAVATGGAAAAGAMAVSTTGATGATAGIISAMGYAGFSALCAQATMSLVQNKLHIGRAAKDLVGKDSIKALLTAMAAAGLVAGIGQALNVPVSAADAKGIVDHFQRQALQQGVQAAFSLADGQRLDPQRIAVSVAAQSLGAIGANKIGEYYTNQMVDGVTHKLLHLGMAYGIGGLSGALTGDDVGRQALASGIGALAAETMHDIIKEDETSVAQRVAQKAGERGIALGDTARTRPIILDEIRARLEVSKFAGAMAAFFAKQDVSTASTAATTAIENNSAQALVAAVDVVLLARAAILGIPLASAGTIGFGSKGKKQPTSIKELKEELGISSMDAVPEDAGFKDKGITPVDARQEPLSTPMPEERRSEPLATPVADTLPTSEGFGAYDGPSASVLENSIKGRLKTAGLPTEGKIRFVPRQDYYPSQPLPKGDGGGYLDRFGNEWVAGASRTAGQTFEWDVQLSRQGASQLGWASRDKKHLNVSLDGKITHK